MMWCGNTLGAAVRGIPLLLALSIFPAAVSAETVKISGTGGALGGMKLLAEAFQRANPGVEVVVAPSIGSSGGIRAAIAGKLDIGVSARRILPEERSRAGLQQPYARTAFVFCANPAVKQSDITLSEIGDIYAGRKTGWGDGSPLRLILRPASDTDTLTLGKISPEMSDAVELSQKREGLIVAMSDQESADAVERTTGGFGTTTLALVASENRKLRILSVDGVTPSAKTVRDGSYPYTKTFFLITGPNLSPAAARFIRFVLSPEGKSVLSRVGHVPLQ